MGVLIGPLTFLGRVSRGEQCPSPFSTLDWRDATRARHGSEEQIGAGVEAAITLGLMKSLAPQGANSRDVAGTQAAGAPS